MNLDQKEIESVVLEPDRVVVNVEQSQENSTVMIVQSENGAEGKNILENDTVAINQCAKDSSVIIKQCSGGLAKDEGGDMTEDLEVESSEGEILKRKARAKETRRRRTKGLGGLQLEKTGIWTVRCIINGRRISKSTGTRDRAEAEQFAKRFMAPYVKDDAERTFENIQAAVMTERQLAAMREAEGPQLTIADMWSAYVASPMRRDLAQTTLSGKEQVVRKFVEHLNLLFPEVTEVRHLTRYHTENYLNSLRKDHSASTYNNRLCVLREVHRTIMKKAAAKENPWDGFPLRADDSHTRRELTIEELARLVDMASRESAEFRTLFGIAMYTGMRLGDCCKLTWAEVDIVRSIIQKVPEKTKKYRRGRPVTIPIHKVLADLLMQTPIENRTGYVLPQIGEWAALGAKGMGRIHHRIGKIFHNAGIVTSVKIEGRKWKAPEASFHSLRHTFVSMSANAGVPLHIVQAIVGHESTAMTRHYYHENVAALQQAVEAIPSISETGDISEGKVAQPDASRLAYKGCNAPTSPCVKGQAALPNNVPQAPQIAYEAEPAIVVSADGVERANPHVEAPATGRFAERSLARREEKLASVEAANSDAQQLGGWGENAPQTAVTPSRDRKERNEWIGRCVRRWCQLKKTSLLEGTSKLVGNGGYRFLQELWERGTAISLEDALDGLDVYLNAKKG